MALTEIPVELSSTPGIADSSNATAITIDSSENVAITGTLSSTTLTATTGVLNLDDNGSHNGVINAPASLFVNIDSDNGATGENFVIAKDRTATSGGTELLRVQEDGKVGIGEATPSDYYADTLVVKGADEGGITIAVADTYGYRSLLAFADDDSGDARYAGYLAYDHGTDAMTLHGGGAGTERVRIKSDGTVGIGDDNPSTYLTIKYSSSSQEHGVTVRNLQSGGYGAAFTVKSTGDSEQIAARFLVQGENNWGDASSQDSTIYLQTLSDNSLDGRIRIYASGYTAVKGHMTPWTDDTYDLGQSSYRWDDIYATNNTIQTSDKNLKDNITESDLGLSFIKELKPVSYKWKDKTRTHYGLIAQDVKETLDSISKSTTDFAGYIENKQYTLGDGDDPLTSDKRPTESEDKILGLRYQEFMAPLIKAIQEQQALIETLQTKVKALEEA